MAYSVPVISMIIMHVGAWKMLLLLFHVSAV